MSKNIALPEWNLADLYEAPTAPKFASDVGLAAKMAKAFQAKYKEMLAGLDGKGLAQALADYEAVSDLIGRIGSYAQLYYVGNTTDAERSKFYGDTSSKLTELSTDLLFFELELNLIDDAVLNTALQEPSLAHYKPWIDNLRMEKPYQLDAKLEQLFLEKSQMSRSLNLNSRMTIIF